MVLYQYPGGDGVRSISPPCLKVELALRRVGRPFEIVDCRTPVQARKFSPTGRMPAVRFDDGVVVEDSIRILHELERRFPEAGLSPSDPHERCHDLLWESFFNDHLYWYGFWLRWVDPETSARFADALFGRQPWAFRLAVRLFLLPRQRRRTKHQGFYAKSPAAVREAVVRALDLTVQGLSGGPFLEGRATPGRGDLAAASFLVQVGFRGTMPDIEREVLARPALVRHARAVYDACGCEPTRWLARVAPSAEANA